MAALPLKQAGLIVGKVTKLSNMGTNHLPCAEVRCRGMDFFANMKMYFVKATDVWALDPDAKANLGDTVLLRLSDSNTLKTTSDIQHFVERVIFRHGIIIDPITKKRVLRQDWADQLAMQKNLVEEIVEAPMNEVLSYNEMREIQREKIKNLSKTLSTSTTPSTS